MDNGRRVRTLACRFVFLLGLTLFFFATMKPLEGLLVGPTVKMIAFLSSLVFGDVYVTGNVVIIGNVEIAIEKACTPVTFWALLLAYLLLDWGGRRSMITLLLGIVILFFVNALRVPLIVLLVEHGMSFIAAHQLSEFLLYLIAFLIIIWLNSGSGVSL